MNYSAQRGLTLIELLVALVIFITLISVSAPGLFATITRYQQNSVTKDYFSGLQYARQSAIFRNQLVTVCPLYQESCSQDWSHPITVFLDPSNKKNPFHDKSEILKVIDAPPESTKINIRPATKPYFQFRPDGTSHGTPGSLLIFHQVGEITEEHRIIISWGGRIRLLL